ncbi:hypothetical protein HY251_18255 [bacterium]|nr:hypothetical protein [bacterium]
MLFFLAPEWKRVLEDVKKALAKEDESFHDSLEGVLRLYVDEEHLERAVEVVRRLVFGLPDNLELLVQLSCIPEASPAAKGVARATLGYVAGKEDLLPESRYGIYGYLDDAYLVSRSLLLVHASLPKEASAKISTEEEHYVKLDRLLVLAQRLLPAEVRAGLDAKLASSKALLEKGEPAGRGVAIVALRPEDPLQAFAAFLARRFPAPA